MMVVPYSIFFDGTLSVTKLSFYNLFTYIIFRCHIPFKRKKLTHACLKLNQQSYDELETLPFISIVPLSVGSSLILTFTKLELPLPTIATLDVTHKFMSFKVFLPLGTYILQEYS
jgi:hypothetical protein